MTPTTRLQPSTRAIRRVGCAALLVLSVTGTSSAEEQPPLSIGVFGGDGAVWAYRQDASRDAQGKLLRFAYQMSGSSPGRFWAGPIVVGDVAIGAGSGTSLHLFFRDGTHRHYIPDPRIMRSGPPFTDLGEVNLPGEQPPLSACWDQASSHLVAVISSAQAAALTPRNPKPQDTDGIRPVAPEPGGKAPPGAILTQPGHLTPTLIIDTPFALAQYESRRWSVSSGTPRDLLARDAVVGILSDDDHVHLLYRAQDVDGTYRHRQRFAGAEQWSEPVMVELPESAVPLTLGWHDETPVLIYRESARSGVTVASQRFENDAWTSGPALSKNAAEAQTFEEPLAVGMSGDSVIVSTIDERGDVRIGTWSIATGGSQQAPSIVPPLAPSLFSQVDPNTQHLLQYAILLGALGAVFVWRRDSVMSVVPVGPHYRYARFQHRMLALTLDLVILAPVWGVVLYQLIDRSDQGISFTEQLLQPRNALPAVWFWSWAIIGAIFAAYATLFEHWLGATPGKRILGCRVVAEQGQRCSFRAILIRNAVRPIEFHFTAIAFLVFMTPSRQRLGDILGRAIVVERIDADAPTATHDEDDDHTDVVV